MDEHDHLAEQFDAHRAHLRAVAYRMLGSSGDADDAVQQAWLRLHGRDTTAVDNFGGWLTTIVARVCLDMLRSRRSRREISGGTDDLEPGSTTERSHGPERDAVIADSIGLAMIVVLEALNPAERIAFVLHDMFDVPFDEIAPIVERSPQATRKLASRARRRVQGTTPDAHVDRSRHRDVVDAFLAASRNGEFARLVAILDPDIVLEADPVAVGMGSPAQLLGADAVARTFSGRALTAQPAIIDGAVGVVWAVRGWPKVAWDFTIHNGRVVHIDMIADPDVLDDLDLTILDN